MTLPLSLSPTPTPAPPPRDNLKVGDLERIHCFSLWGVFFGSQLYYDLSHLNKFTDDTNRVLWPTFHSIVLLFGWPFYLGLCKLRQAVRAHNLRNGGIWQVGRPKRVCRGPTVVALKWRRPSSPALKRPPHPCFSCARPWTT